jgi:hypothetical protein
MTTRTHRTGRTVRSILATAALVGASLLAAGAAPAVGSAGPGSPVPETATVPADRLGPDWVLGVVTRGDFQRLHPEGLGRSLELVAPDGTRHPVWSTDVRENSQGWFDGDFTLVDWSPVTHTALLRVYGPNGGSRAVSYDVTTGEEHVVRLPQDVASVGLAPDGTGVVTVGYPTRPRRGGRLGVLGWDGATTTLPGRADQPSLTSPDGTTLVTSESTRHRWWVVDLVARTASRVETVEGCLPRRWYDATSVVATCLGPRGSRLFRIDLDGSRTPLAVRHRTNRRGFHGPVWDDSDVRTVQGRTWYESNGPCGGSFLSRQTAAGKVRLVEVPGVDAGISLVGARGDDLVVAHTETCDTRPPRGVLSLVDPVTRTERVLLRLGRRETWRHVQDAAEVRAWGW